MTYTSGYQSPNVAGQSAYSPFSRTQQAPQQPGQYAGYPPAVGGENPFPGVSNGSTLGTDTYLPPSSPEDIDSLSGNIDSKIAEIRRAFSQPAPSAAPPATLPGAPSAPPVSQDEMNWALALENKVKTQNYQPTPEETAQYEQIFNRLQAAAQGGQTPPAAPGTPTPGATPPAASRVSDEEISWALDLEKKVNDGYQPNAQETAQYNSIFNRINAPQTPAAPPSGAPAPAAAPVSQEEMNWALTLENKVKTQNYQPTPEETARYEQIFARLQAAQQAATQGQGNAPQVGADQRNWAQWSQPFNVPAAPTMPLPIAGPGGQPIINVPTSLVGAPQRPPSAVLNQAPGQAAGAPPAAPSQAEIDWALQLEARVQQGQEPTPQETAQYQDIARRLQAAQSAPPAAPAATPPPTGGAMPSQPAPQVNPQGGPPPLPPGVTQADIDWALQLEARAEQGQQPTPQETARYQQIAQQLQAAQNAVAAQQQPPAAPPQTTPPPAAPPAQSGQALPNGLTQQDIQWAMDLEARVNQQGYQPNPQELERHTNIAQRLQAPAPQQTAPAFPQQQGGVQNVVPQGPQPVQIMPQGYPQVQTQTPQMVVPYQPGNSQIPLPPGPQGYAPPGQMPPGGPPPPAQGQSPSFMTRLGNAWNALWQ